MLVRMSPAPADPGTFTGGYDLVVLDPRDGRFVAARPGQRIAEIVEAVGVYARPVRGPDLPAAFVSAIDEPNGHTQVTPNTPTVDLTVLDFRVLATLLFQNTPTGRDYDPGVSSVDIYEDLPPTPDVTSLTSGSQYIAKDAFGSLYVRRRLIGSATLLDDGSLHAKIPGGVPLVLHLPDTTLSKEHKYPRWQREEMEFSPGEQTFQSFPLAFFDNVCGQCHGSITGQQVDVAVNPDVLTQASSSRRTHGARSVARTNPRLPIVDDRRPPRDAIVRGRFGVRARLSLCPCRAPRPSFRRRGLRPRPSPARGRDRARHRPPR